MKSFSARIYIIGINPYVLLPAPVLKYIFQRAGKSKGPIPVHGKINGHPYIQTLIKYSGKWRLYLNTPMRKAAGIDVGNIGNFDIDYDPRPRIVPLPESLKKAFNKNKKAKAAFHSLTPSRQKEISRYISNLKSKQAIAKNTALAIQFLLGKQRFVGRDKP